MQGFRLAIEWGNPHKDPPEGRPVVLAEKYVITDGGGPPMPEEFKELAPLGSGYHFTIRHIGEPTKPISQEARASVRQKRLKRRLKEKFPLFVEQFYSEQVENNRDYYQGITAPKLQEAYNAAVEWEKMEYEKLMRLGERIDGMTQDKMSI